MEMQDIFHTGLYFIIISSVVLSPNEKEFLQELHERRNDYQNFSMSEEEKQQLLNIYKLTIEVLAQNIETISNIIQYMES